MGWNFRKSIKIGPARINLSKSGVGYSVGAGGVRYTKRAGGKKKKSDTGCLTACIKGMLWLFVAAVIFYLVSEYWKWLVALAAIAAAAAIGYWIWIQRQSHLKEETKTELHDNDPAS